MKVAKASIQVLLRKAYEVGAPVNGHFVIHWETTNWYGELEVMKGEVVKSVRYERGNLEPADGTMVFVPITASITSVTCLTDYSFEESVPFGEVTFFISKEYDGPWYIDYKGPLDNEDFMRNMLDIGFCAETIMYCMNRAFQKEMPHIYGH